MKRALTTVTAAALSCFAVAARPLRPASKPHAAAAQDVPRREPRHRLEPVPARPAGHPGRPARHRPPDLRARDHARGDLRRRRSIDRARSRTSRGARRHRLAEAAADAAAHDTLVALYPALRASIDQQYATALAARPDGRAPRAGRRASASRPRQQILRAARERRLGRRRRCRSRPARRPATTSSRRPPSRSRSSPTGGTSSRSSCARAASSVRRPPPALDEPQVRRRARRGAGARRRDRLDADRRPDADRPVLEPADLGDLEPDRADRRPRPPRRPGRGRAHVRGADLAFADAVIAFYDAKYTYRLWRPVTAIRAHAADPDAGRRSRTPRPTRPIPGAHGTISAAGADVLAADLRQRLRVHRRLDRAAGRRAHVRRASPRRRRRRASAASTTATTRRLDQVAGENLGHDVAGLILGRQTFIGR